MKAITLHPTSTSGGGTVIGGGVYLGMDNSTDSKDRRTSTGGPGEAASMQSSMAAGGPNNGISGLGNIDSTVHHYELPNLAQCKTIEFITALISIVRLYKQRTRHDHALLPHWQL